MQNSSGTALNLFLNNDTEKKQLHLLSTEGDFVYHKDKKEGKKKFLSHLPNIKID